jgi:hypothetical protein
VVFSVNYEALPDEGAGFDSVTAGLDSAAGFNSLVEAEDESELDFSDAEPPEGLEA